MSVDSSAGPAGSSAGPADSADSAGSAGSAALLPAPPARRLGATAGPTLPVGSMFSLGWLMAQLFGPVQRRRGSDTSAHLPTISELGADSYLQIAFVELEKLLAPWPSLSDADIKAAWNTADHEGFTAAVKTLHLGILRKLVDDHQQLSAYELGRALSDTCWLPDENTGGELVLKEFGRHRLATLQAWLTEAGGALPSQSAATVSRSLQSWQDWTDINAAQIKDGWTTTHASVVAALRTQASAWQALLAGETDLSGQTSVDAWVHAGQSILRTTRLLMVTIIRRFWPVVLIIAAATGGLLYLATANSSGTTRVWTSLVTVAAALGVSGASLRAAALKAVGGIEQDIRDAATLDARAWSITWLPTMPQSRMQQYRLASRGVAAPQVKKGLTLPEPPTAASPATTQAPVPASLGA